MSTQKNWKELENKISTEAKLTKRSDGVDDELVPHIYSAVNPLHPAVRLVGAKVSIEVGDGLDASEIIFEGDVFIGGVGVFVGQTEAH
jgi:hypothetical protein